MYRNTINPRTITGLLDDIFQQGISRTTEAINTLGHAPVNIFETETGYELSVVAPGLSKEAFRISIDKNVLNIAFEQAEDAEVLAGNWLRKEYKTRSFKRSFNLNEKIDAAGIAAKYADGILVLSLPKKTVAETSAQEIPVS